MCVAVVPIEVLKLNSGKLNLKLKTDVSTPIWWFSAKYYYNNPMSHGRYCLLQGLLSS